MRLKNLNTKKQISFKKRFKKTKSLFYNNKEIYWIVKKNYFIEYVYFEFIRKLIKKSIKYKSNLIKNNFWIYLKYNTPITRKSKNSRMGKGKGSLKKWGVEIPKNFKIFKVKFYFIFFKRIMDRLERKSNIKLYLYKS